MTADELDNLAYRALRAIVQVERLANDLTEHANELRGLIEQIKETPDDE